MTADGPADSNVTTDPLAQLRRDIARAEAERAVLREVLESIDGSVAVFGSSQEYRYANSAYFELFPHLGDDTAMQGRDYATALAMSIDAGAIPDPLARNDPAAFIASRVADLDDRTKTEREVYNPLHDRWLQLRVKWTPSGNSVAFRVDITELKRLQQEVLRAQRVETIGRTSAGVAHDFNNLLTVIISTLEMIRLRAREPARVASMAATALESADSGARLVRQLLTYARRDVTQPRLLDANEVLANISELLHRTAGTRVVLELQFGQQPGLGLARFDASQFEGAMLNLVMNARHAVEAAYGADSGRARIVVATARAPDGRLAVSVADNGIGMPPEIAAHAFEPFFTTREIGGGSGLGLSQVYGFATGSAGEAKIASTVGAGTTVTILLPREAP